MVFSSKSCQRCTCTEMLQVSSCLQGQMNQAISIGIKCTQGMMSSMEGEYFLDDETRENKATKGGTNFSQQQMVNWGMGFQILAQSWRFGN